MRNLLLLVFTLIFYKEAKSQANTFLSSALVQVSQQWQEDSNSCKGYRKILVQSLLNSQISDVNKDQILKYLGSPNRVEKVYNGVTKRNYIAIIYDVYKDACPRTEVEGFAIQFVFEERGSRLVEVLEIDYCG